MKLVRAFARSTRSWLPSASTVALLAVLGACTPAEETPPPADNGMEINLPASAIPPAQPEAAAETPAETPADAHDHSDPAHQHAEPEAAAETPADAHDHSDPAHQHAEPEAAEPAPATPEQGTAAAGGVTGMIKFSGERPARVTLQTRADPKCQAMHKDEPLLSDNEIVGENGELANVFVYVTNPPEGEYGPASEPFVLDQKGCRYEPHVFGVVAGTEVEAHNNDDTLHNVRSFARINAPFNLGQPAGSAPRKSKKPYTKAENAIKIKCDVHPWMLSHMFVMDHPYFGVSGTDGKYTIAGLPAGEYDVTAWHEVYGEQDGKLTVAADGTGTVDFTFEKK